MNGHGALNRIYRVVWNAALGVWQVASEITRGKGKTKSQRTARKGLASIGAGSILLLCHAGAMATLPTGGAVSAGSGNISQNGSTMVIDQSSNKLAIDWQSFNVGAGNTVQFNQPSANAVALNRVMGGDPSVIHGAINANGRVFLLNPNGILFGATSKIEVASLLASTMNLSNEDFMAGNYRFEGSSDKGIVNQGQIKASDGGFIAMVAARIENVGDMQARGGQVVMGSGSKVRLDLGGPVKIEIDEAVIDGYIRNAGMIRADGGTVLMTVKTAGEIASMAINNEGIIQARGLETSDGGSIRLLGDGGIVANSGTLDVSAENGKGGYVEVTGERVGMLDGTVVDASGAQGGGTILLGGDYQGKNADVANARMTYIAEQAVIRANALKQGHGGKIIAWADDSTLYFGKIEAKGGAQSGNGGFVEVSGKQYLDFQGKVDTSAANGSNGTLLLDPTNLTIGNVASSTWITDRDNIFRDFTDADDELNVAHDFSFLRIDVLLEALASNDITVMSACDAAACAGNITVIDAITWNSGKALTLNATGSVTIDAAITSTGAAGVKGGDFSVIAGTAGTGGADGIPGNIVINANITTNGGAADGAGQAGGTVNLSTVNASITLNNSAVISTAGSAAQAGSDANGGAGGNISLTSTTGINLNSGQLLSTGGVADGSGVNGNGGRIALTSTTGGISQSGGRLVARELVANAGNASINLNTGTNSVDRLAAQSTAGNIHFANQNTAGLTVTNIDGVTGVNTGGTGNINLSARNLLVESDITADAGSIVLNANQGQQSGDFAGVHILEVDVTTQGGDITIAGRGGDAEHGRQKGVQISKSIVSAGGAGTVTVTGVGGTNAGDGNEGVLIQGNGIANSDSSMITSDGGQITVNATGGAGVGGDNYAVAFNHGGQIGATTGNRNVLIKTVLGGSTHDAYASDPLGGYIGTGTGNLTLEGNVVNATGGSGGAAPVSVRSTGDLTVQSAAGASFDGTFNLSEFAQGFVFNGSPSGLNDVRSLTIGREGNTSDIQMNQALDMNGGSISLTGGNVGLDDSLRASSLTVLASGNINQSETNGSFTLGSGNLTSTGGDITLKGTGNRIDSLTATTPGAITFDNGANHLSLGGTLSGASVHLNAGSLSQSGGTITTGALEVTTSNGGVTLNQDNNVGILAVNANGGNLTFNNGGSTDVLTIGTVGGAIVDSMIVGETTGVRSTGSVILNGIHDLEITEGVSATGVTINAGSRNIDLGTETDGAKLSLTDAEIDRITAASLTLETTGNVTNSAAVLAEHLTAMTIAAGQGITNSGSGQLGFSSTDTGSLTLTSKASGSSTGIGSDANVLITVGASHLVLTSGGDIRVDARARNNAAADLATLHIESKSAGESYGYGVASTATLLLTGGADIGWDRGVNPALKGAYGLSLQNTDALDFRFLGNAPVNVTASSIDAANFYIDSNHNINVTGAITGTRGAITLKGNAGYQQTGNFAGVRVGAALTTDSGSITLDGRGGNGRNGNNINNDQSNQHGVNVIGNITAGEGGSISITGQGGSSSLGGSNHDGVLISGAISASDGNISISGTGGGGMLNGNTLHTTSDGIVFAGTGSVTSTNGNVRLTGDAGNGQENVKRAIVQSGSGIITARGLEVILAQNERVQLSNENRVQKLAADIHGNFNFNNAGLGTLDIDRVNERDGISAASTANITLRGLDALTVKESIAMTGGMLHIGADAINIDDDRSIGDLPTSQARNAHITLTSRGSTRSIDIGSQTPGKLSTTADLLSKVYGNSLTLQTSSAIDVTANVDFPNIQSLTLSGGAISSDSGHYLRLSSMNDKGSVTFNGSSVGASGAAVITHGADSISVQSSSNINVAAYTNDGTALIDLSSLSIHSNAGGQNLDYVVQSGSNLNYSVAGTGPGAYMVSANSDTAPVDFTFTANGHVTIADSDMKGGDFTARSSSGNVVVDEAVDIVAKHVTLDAATTVTVSDKAKIDSDSAWLEGGTAIIFDGEGALTAQNDITLRTKYVSGTLITAQGAIESTDGKINVRADHVTIGAGGLSADTQLAFTTTTLGHSVRLGGGADAGSLTLTTATLANLEASELVIGSSDQFNSVGAVTLAGDVDLGTRINTLSINGYSGGVTQSAGTLMVDTLNVVHHHHNATHGITLNQDNVIRNFQALTHGGGITLNNSGMQSLDIKNLNSRGGEISVTTAGDLRVNRGAEVRSVASTTANGGTILLHSNGGNLAVLGNVSADGNVNGGQSAQNGGTITLRGESIELGAVTISSNGTRNWSTGSTNGGNAGALNLDANAGTITLDGTSISLVGGSGGNAGQQGNGSSLTFSNAVVLGSLDNSNNAGDVIISTGGADVRFMQGVNGGTSIGHNLSINSSRWNGSKDVYGDVSFDQSVGVARVIGNLDLYNVQDVMLVSVNARSISIASTDGTTRVNGVLEATGSQGIDITAASIVNGAAASYVTTGNGDIRLYATDDAMTLSDLDAFSSTGAIALGAADGLFIDAASLVTHGGGVSFLSATTLGHNLTIDTTNVGAAAVGGNVTFAGTLDSATGTTSNLTINAGTAGNVNMQGAVGATEALGEVVIVSVNDLSTGAVTAASFTQQAGTGTTTIGGAHTLSGGFAFTGNALTVNQALNAASATVTNAGQFKTGGAGDITVAGIFRQNGAGKSVLAGDINTTNSHISFATPVEFAGTMKLDTGTGAGDITFSGTLDSNVTNDISTVTLNAGSGTIGFDGNVGATRALGNLVVNSGADVTLPVSVSARSLTTNAAGSTILRDGATITTSGAQTYGDAVMLNGDVVLASTGSGAITFSNTVNGAHNLAVNTNGTTTFGGAVGGTTALTSLTTNAGGTTVFNGGAVSTTGSQTYGDNVKLGVDTILSSTNGGAITFNGTVDSAGDVRSLQVNTSGTTTFGGAVGDHQELASITVSNQAGTLLMNGGSIATAGTQTYHSGTIILGGNTMLRSGGTGVNGNITLNGDIDAAICTVASLDVVTQGATVFGGAIGTYRPLWSVTTDGAASETNTVTFDNGTVITLKEQTYGETVILGTDTKLTSLGQGDITFNGPVRAKDDGVQSLTVDTSGDIVFNGAVGDNNQRLASFDAGDSIDGMVKINGGGITTTGTQVYRQQVELGNNAILTGTTGTFNVGIDGKGNDLTLRFSGPTELEGAKFTGVQNLASEGAGVTNVTGTIATSGTQTYTSDVVLGSDVVLQSTGIGAAGNITLGKADGAHALRIETAGTTALADTVGGTTALTSLTTDGPGVTAIGANVRTSGAQTYGDTVQMTANASLTSTGGGNIVFEGEVEGPHGLTVNTTGTTRFDGNAGGATALASLTTDAGGSVEINGGSVTTIGAQTYGDAVKLGADTTLASIDGGNITFAGTLGGAHALSVNTDGTTRFGGEVGGTTALASLITDGPGATVISGGKVTTTGAQTYGDAVTLATNTVLTSEDDADIVFSDTVDGGGALTVNTGGTTRFDGEVGGATALASLTTDADGSVEVYGGRVRTVGAQNYGDAVTLGADASFETTGNGNISFAGTVDGAHNMTVDTGGTARFNQVVGGTTELVSLTTRGAGSVALNGGSVNTSGDQTYGNAVTLEANTVLASSGNGDITFYRTLDGAHALTVETDGDTVFNGAVGGRTALASISTDAGGNAVINGGSVRTTGAQTFNDGVVVGANAVFSSKGPITFADTLDGPWNVTVQTPGVTTFGGAIGSIAPVANLNVGAGRGTIDILGPSITLSGSLTFEDAVYVKAPTTVNVGGDALFYGDAREGKALLDVTAGGRIQFGRPIDNLKTYLPALFTERNAGQPANRHMADNTTGRPLSFGRLELVNVNVGGASTSNAGGMQVDEGVVDRTVGRIAAGNHANRAGAQTYVVTVNGGVRPPAAGEVQEEKGADQAS